MAVRIAWSLLAREDLAKIHSYIRRDDPEAAKALLLAIRNKIQLLPDFPQMGRVVPEKKDPLLREIIHDVYRIVYFYGAEQGMIYILRIWHAARGEPDVEVNP
jgi:toxin ParE1/3/4